MVGLGETHGKILRVMCGLRKAQRRDGDHRPAPGVVKFTPVGTPLPALRLQDVRSESVQEVSHTRPSARSRAARMSRRTGAQLRLGDYGVMKWKVASLSRDLADQANLLHAAARHLRSTRNFISTSPKYCGLDCQQFSNFTECFDQIWKCDLYFGQRQRSNISQLILDSCQRSVCPEADSALSTNHDPIHPIE